MQRCHPVLAAPLCRCILTQSTSFAACTSRPCVVYDARDCVKAWRLILQPDTGLNNTRITCVSDPWDTDAASMPKLAAFVDARRRLYCKEWFMEYGQPGSCSCGPFANHQGQALVHLLWCLWAVTLQSWTFSAAQLQAQVLSQGKHPGDMGQSYQLQFHRSAMSCSFTCLGWRLWGGKEKHPGVMRQIY